MGSLRIESKNRMLEPARYEEYRELLSRALAVSENSHVFYDLDPGEQLVEVVRELTFVAEREGVELKVRRVRGTASLRLLFTSGSSRQPGRRGISAEDAQDLILRVLGEAGGPLSRKEILEQCRISMASWNLRIRELVSVGAVVRRGKLGNSRYELREFA